MPTQPDDQSESGKIRIRRPMRDADHINLRRLFEQEITAREITCGLRSFDETGSAQSCKAILDKLEYDVAGIRKNGIVHGYVVTKDLADTMLGRYHVRFSKNDVIDENDSLLACLHCLTTKERVFVRTCGEIGGIVTRADLQKPVVRLWIFGLITLLETLANETLRERLKVEGVRAGLPEGSKVKNEAERFYKIRTDKQEQIDFISCVALEPKLKLLEAELRSADISGDDRAKIKDLRDNLAHTQALPVGKWDNLYSTILKIEKAISTLLALRRNEESHDT